MSEPALHLMAENKRTKNPSLDSTINEPWK